VIDPVISHAEFGLTVFSHASMKDFESVSLHTLPIIEKLYAATIPKIVHTIEAGINELLSSAKKATPDGNDNTPAPMTLFARLKVDTAIDDFPLESIIILSFGLLLSLLAIMDAVDFKEVIVDDDDDDDCVDTM
jgi:hypothetical protein